ncbi:MAG: metallophosphoesterase [Christensenellales bacterium]|jgi:predicted MPP superfamily phosphohydrolase
MNFNKSRETSLRRRALLWGVAVALCLAIPGFYSGLKVQTYTIRSEKVTQAFRIALIADLHSCFYGEELIEAVHAQQPDLVLFGGDIFDDELADDNAAALLSALGARYPCYYVTGNHEHWSGASAFAEKMRIVRESRVVRLDDEAVHITVRGVPVNLCGVGDPDGMHAADLDGALEKVAGTCGNGGFSILLSHRPERFAEYCRYPFDLVLSGHAHGGQWRIPGLVNGIFAPDQGLFPKYAGGIYTKNGTMMIVSRGLARETTPVPRFYNRPELAIVDMLPSKNNTKN